MELAEADQFQRVRRAAPVARVRLNWLTGRWDGLPGQIAELALPDDVDPGDQLDSGGWRPRNLGADRDSR